MMFSSRGGRATAGERTPATWHRVTRKDVCVQSVSCAVVIAKLYRLQNAAARRWYQIDTGLDLFGERVLVRRWGAAGSAHGGMSTTVLTSSEALEQAVTGEMKRRSRRGYVVAGERTM